MKDPYEILQELLKCFSMFNISTWYEKLMFKKMSQILWKSSASSVILFGYELDNPKI